LISFKTPEAGAGISASTLSVEISNSGSSRCTLSPGFLSHLVMVPSKMDSPICGMMISVAMVPSSRPPLECTEREQNIIYSAGRAELGCGKRPVIYRPVGLRLGGQAISESGLWRALLL